MVRPSLSFVSLALAVLAFALFAVDRVDDAESALSLGALLGDGIEPRALGAAALFGLGACFLGHAERGPLGRGARVAVHTFLWASALANLTVVLALLTGDASTVAWREVARVEAGGWCALFVLAALDLAAPRRLGRVVRALDAGAALTLLLSIAALLLDVLQRRAAPLDPPPGWSAPGIGLPRFGAVGAGDIAAGLALVLLVPWLLDRLRGRDAASDRRHLLPLLLGALGAVAVELGGLRLLAASGGQASPAELEAIAGRMAVPAVLGVIAWIAVGLRQRTRERREAGGEPSGSGASAPQRA